jgi:P27 family predicted phage terminase small subunit
MAPRGKKPLPSNVHQLHGNPGKRPLNDREPSPPIGRPRMPKDFDAVAQREWKRQAPVLRELGILTKIDHAMFEAYCQTYADWIKYTELAQKTPLVKTPSGRIRISPYMELADRALKNLRAIATEFGLTPSSRSRIKAEPPENEDELEKFLHR